MTSCQAKLQEDTYFRVMGILQDLIKGFKELQYRGYDSLHP